MQQRPIPTKVTPLRKPQRTQEELKKDHRKGWLVLDRLFEVAHRDSGQPRYIAAYLLDLYSGIRFPCTAD